MDEYKTISAYSKLSLSFEVTISLGQRKNFPLLLCAYQRWDLHGAGKAEEHISLLFILPKAADSGELRLEKPSGSDMQMRTPGFTLGSFTFLWSGNFLLWKQCWKIAGDVSVMSTICIPLIFLQKTQDSKPHNVLENHRQSFSSLVSSCLALQLGGSLWHSSTMKCVLFAPETGQLQLLPIVHPPGRGKESRREVTNQPRATEHQHLAANPAA